MRSSLQWRRFSLPLSPRLSKGVITYSTTYPPIPIVLYLLILLLYAISILERDEAVQLPYRDDTPDGGVCDDHGGDGWNADGYDTESRVRMA